MSAAQLNLKEPAQVDWDIAFKGSSFEAPPPALGPDDKPIEYQAQIVKVEETEADEGYLNYKVELKLTQPGVNYSRSLLAWVSARPFMKRIDGELQPMKGNPNALAKFLRGAGLQGKPQTNEQYRDAMKRVNNTTRVKITGDWVAKSKDGTEVIRGFRAFPPDEGYPGKRKAILKRGDIYQEIDRQGNVIGTKTVENEILFANFQVKYFSDPTPRAGTAAR